MCDSHKKKIEKTNHTKLQFFNKNEITVQTYKRFEVNEDKEFHS